MLQSNFLIEAFSERAVFMRDTRGYINVSTLATKTITINIVISLLLLLFILIIILKKCSPYIQT
jgi:hypothetical protein